jgi:hypothetical protein
MEFKTKELIIFIIIVIIAIAFIVTEDRRMSILVLVGGAIGSIIGNVVSTGILDDWLYKESS